MAAIGLGLKTTARLLGLPNHGRVASAWKVRGISRRVPAVGSWDLHARRNGFNGITKTMLVLPWWGDDEAAKGWRSNEKAKFPDWSYLWYKEKAKESGNLRYQSMSDEERKAFNRRCWENRSARHSIDPDAKRKDRARINEWKKRNPEKNNASVRKSMRNRKLRDPGFRVACNLRNRLKEIMGVVRDPARKWNSSMIGCDTRQLAAHLESKFKRGMSWENYGTHWHVDHIIPCAAFDQLDPEQRKRCWHWTNLAPLEAAKNLAKGAKIEAPQLSLLLTV